MTLLDAPTYDPTKAHRRKTFLIAGAITLVVLAGLLWFFWDWPQEHRVNQFFAAIEANGAPHDRLRREGLHPQGWLAVARGLRCYP